MDKVVFRSEEGDEISFFVIEETRLNGTQYLLVTEQDPGVEEDGDATVLKCVEENDEDAVYEFVVDDAEWDAILPLFRELLEDTDFVEE